MSLHWARIAVLLAGCLAAQSPGRAQVNVTTYHNDNSRTGQNLSETVLTPATVSSGQFELLFTQVVDGYVYAQPLYVSGLQIGGQAHNVVFVATQHDSVYAFDADGNTGSNAAPLWHVNFTNPGGGITTVNSSDVSCYDITPEIGITGTPVIDLTSNTLYVVVRTKENGAFFQRLHALDITSGAEKFGGPSVIQASVAGSGNGSIGGQLSFDPLLENQRPGLLLQNGLVYIAWAAHCDNPPFHGWVVAYNAQTLQQVAVWNSTPNGSDGGVWQSGAPPAADANGNVFLATGNGTFDIASGGVDAGDSIVKLGMPAGGTLPLLDYFTPFNQAGLSVSDTDLGAGGVVLLPGLPGTAHPNLLVQVGKQGTIYLLDRDQMGGFNPAGDTQVVESLPNVIGGVRGTPAFWNGNVYVGGTNDHLKAFSFNANNSGLLSTSPISSTTEVFDFPGPTPSVSASGTSGALVWAIEQDIASAILRAYDATNLSNELYNSTQRAQDALGPPVKFSVPTIANGKVYVGTTAQLAVFGLANAPPAPVLLSPANGSTGLGNSQVLSWNAATGAASYNVYFGTASPPPLAGNQPGTSFTTPTLAAGTTYYWSVVAVNSFGATSSPIWSFTTGAPAAPVLISPASGATGVSTATALTWSAAGGATSYAVYLGPSTPPPEVATTGATSYTPSALNANSQYYWSVGAMNSFGATDSAIWTFTTGPCTVALNPVALYFDSTAQPATDGVSAPPNCSWSASTIGNFLSITSGGTGAGDGSIGLNAPANNSGAPLSGTLNVSPVSGQGASAPVIQRETATVFTDFDPSAYYFDFVNTIYQRGITGGCLLNPPEYCPNDPVTRGEMAVFLVTAVEGGDNFTYTTNPYFTDVPPSYPFFRFIQKLRDLGITNGCSLTEFCPDDAATRAQMAAFIIRARYESTPYTYPSVPYFSDVPPEDIFFPMVQKMAQVGITAGCAPSLYCPDDSVTRGQTAVFVVTGLLNLLLPQTPLIASAAPNSVAVGQTVLATLTGVNTHFAQGTTQVTVGAGLTPSSVTVNSGTSLTLQLTADASAGPGPYSIVVTTGAEEAVLPNGFMVTAQ